MLNAFCLNFDLLLAGESELSVLNGACSILLGRHTQAPQGVFVALIIVTCPIIIIITIFIWPHCALSLSTGFA